jgi:hypothetical protein
MENLPRRTRQDTPQALPFPYSFRGFLRALCRKFDGSAILNQHLAFANRTISPCRVNLLHHWRKHNVRTTVRTSDAVIVSLQLD